MPRLTAAQRRKLPSQAFALPESRRYPIHNISHARDAIREVDANGSPEEQSRVKAAVRSRYPSIQIGGKEQ